MANGFEGMMFVQLNNYYYYNETPLYKEETRALAVSGYSRPFQQRTEICASSPFPCISIFTCSIIQSLNQGLLVKISGRLQPMVRNQRWGLSYSWTNLLRNSKLRSTHSKMFQSIKSDGKEDGSTSAQYNAAKPKKFWFGSLFDISTCLLHNIV